MSDFQKLKKVFDELKIGYEEYVDETGMGLILEANVHQNVGGYTDFAASFGFDREGKSLGVGIYE